jgi:hypothetical protein
VLSGPFLLFELLGEVLLFPDNRLPDPVCVDGDGVLVGFRLSRAFLGILYDFLVFWSIPDDGVGGGDGLESGSFDFLDFSLFKLGFRSRFRDDDDESVEFRDDLELFLLDFLL